MLVLRNRVFLHLGNAHMNLPQRQDSQEIYHKKKKWKINLNPYHEDINPLDVPYIEDMAISVDWDA